VPTLPATITASTGAVLAASAVIPVDPVGAVLAFEVPADSELVAAALTLVAPGDDRSIDLLAGPSAATLASSQGPGAPPRDLAVAWFTADWRTRRPLSALSVTVAGNTPGLVGIIKLAEDGPWYPPSPGRLTLGQNQRLPALLATRLMIEFMTEAADKLTPASAIVTAFGLQAAARPGDLTLAQGATLFASHALPFDPREAWTVDRELLAVLQDSLGDRGGPASIRLRSAEPGLLQRLTLAIDRIPRLRRFTADAPEVRLDLPADGHARAAIDLPADAQLTSIAFTARADLAHERPAVPVDNDPPGPHAHRVDPARSAAQCFTHAPGAALVGLDLHLRPLAGVVQCTAAIHADQFGEPAAAPLATIALGRVFPTDPPWPSEWWRFDLPEPLALPDGPWWVALAVTRGDLLWHLDVRPPPDAPGAPQPRSARHRHGVDAWLVREVPGPGPVRQLVVPWARTRVRLAVDPAAPPPAPTLRLQWRGKTIDLTPDADGRISLGPDQLAEFAGQPPGPLAILVATTVAGAVTLGDLHIRLAQVRDTFALGPV
jgi:hypothetical protein